MLSPRWDDEEPTVAFDRNSGDYWVITEATRRLIEQLIEHPGQAIDRLTRDTAHQEETLNILHELTSLEIVSAETQC